MKLLEGQSAEYQLRHQQLWPELGALLKATGIERYSIFLDQPSNTLFACLDISDPAALDRLRQEALMWKWWDYMKDIMETNADHSPVTGPLRELFYLP